MSLIRSPKVNQPPADSLQPRAYGGPLLPDHRRKDISMNRISITLSTAIVLAVAYAAQADIIHSGPVAGATITGRPYWEHIAFDLDSSDYTIGWYPTTGKTNELLFRGQDIIGQSPSILRGVVTTENNNQIGMQLSAGDVIGSTSAWSPWAFIGGVSDINPEWVTGDDVDGFAGLKVAIDDQIHYGWMHITYDSTSDTWSLLEWAYNDTPNESITAAQVPEPTTAALLLFGGMAVVIRHRSRRTNLTFRSSLKR